MQQEVVQAVLASNLIERHKKVICLLMKTIDGKNKNLTNLALSTSTKKSAAALFTQWCCFNIYIIDEEISNLENNNQVSII
jgi:hypothetical protein